MHTRHASYNVRLPKAPAKPKNSFWKKVVANYTSRDLKNVEDKFPALAGLARRHAELMGWPDEDYLAGLWRATFVSDLVWKREERFTMIISNPDRHGRQLGRARSWSGASIDGTIYIVKGTAIVAKEVEIGLGTAVEHSVKGDQFGKVTSGVLHIHCSFMNVTVHQKDETVDVIFDIYNAATGLRAGHFTADALEDVQKDSPSNIMDNGRLSLICLGLLDSGASGEWQGMAVRYDTARCAFVRLGYFFSAQVDKYGKKDFTIV